MRVDLYLTCNLYFITVAYHYKDKSGNYVLVYAYGSNNKIGLLFYFGGWSRSGAGVSPSTGLYAETSYLSRNEKRRPRRGALDSRRMVVVGCGGAGGWAAGWGWRVVRGMGLEGGHILLLRLIKVTRT